MKRSTEIVRDPIFHAAEQRKLQEARIKARWAEKARGGLESYLSNCPEHEVEFALQAWIDRGGDVYASKTAPEVAGSYLAKRAYDVCKAITFGTLAKDRAETVFRAVTRRAAA